MLKRGLRFEVMLCVWLGVLACVAGGTVASAQQQPAGEAPAGVQQPAGPASFFRVRPESAAPAGAILFRKRRSQT